MSDLKLSNDDLERLAELFEMLKQRMTVVGDTEVGSIDHVRAWREVTTVTSEIESIVPLATEPLN